MSRTINGIIRKLESYSSEKTHCIERLYEPYDPVPLKRFIELFKSEYEMKPFDLPNVLPLNGKHIFFEWEGQRHVRTLCINVSSLSSVYNDYNVCMDKLFQRKLSIAYHEGWEFLRKELSYKF